MFVSRKAAMRHVFVPLAFLLVLAAGCGGSSSADPVPSSTRQAEAAAPTLTAGPAATSTAPPAPSAEPTSTIALPAPTAAAVAAAAPPTATAATQAPPPPIPTATPVQQPSVPPPAVTFNVTASLLSFSTTRLTARSGAAITVNFRNEDAGVTHDLSFSVAGLGHGHTCAGPCSDTYSFTAPSAGTYDFFCTVHAGMEGKLIVTP